MPKKMDRGESKKECPSCGLGVAVEANICEFCGWDFEEEDEWILQIEKLERELLLEKQRFEPGSVGQKIESTLRTPAMEMAEAEREAAKTTQAGAARPQRVADTAEDLIEKESPPAQRQPERIQAAAQEPVVQRAAPVQTPAPAVAPATPQTQPVAQPMPARAPAQQPDASDTGKIRKIRSVRQAAAQPSPADAAQPEPGRQPQGPVLQERKVRIPEPEAQGPAPQELPTRKVRTVRKVKG